MNQQQEAFRSMLSILMDGPAWPRPAARGTAVLILPGIWQEYRIERGMELWPTHGKYLWIGPTRGDTVYDSREKVTAFLEQDSPDIVFGGFASNTPEQMRWCVSMLKAHPEVRHVAVATAAYHLPRCCLTLVKEMEEAKMRIPITPFPLLNPSGDSFSNAGSEDLMGEVERIVEYRSRGDVATVQEWQDYLAWRLAINI